MLKWSKINKKASLNFIPFVLLCFHNLDNAHITTPVRKLNTTGTRFE